MELDWKALAAGLATAAFFAFAAHARSDVSPEPTACATAKSSAVKRCPSPPVKAD